MRQFHVHRHLRAPSHPTVSSSSRFWYILLSNGRPDKFGAIRMKAGVAHFFDLTDTIYRVHDGSRPNCVTPMVENIE